jgi:hypothetical protein
LCPVIREEVACDRILARTHVLMGDCPTPSIAAPAPILCTKFVLGREKAPYFARSSGAGWALEPPAGGSMAVARGVRPGIGTYRRTSVSLLGSTLQPPEEPEVAASPRADVGGLGRWLVVLRRTLQALALLSAPRAFQPGSGRTITFRANYAKYAKYERPIGREPAIGGWPARVEWRRFG